MSRFTEEEFETAFKQVSPTWKYHVDEQCKTFLKIILTNTADYVEEFINDIPKSDSETRDQCLKIIIEHTNINDLNGFIQNINAPSTTTDTISEDLSRYEDLPIARVCLRMFQNREPGLQRAPPASAYPPASAHTSADFPIPKTQKERIQRWWELRNAGRTKEADHYYGANIYLDLPSGVGGSRRRRSSHRKRKSYRKSKRVRHTPRKQTRRRGYRRSRHRR